MNIRPISRCQSNFNEVAELCHSEREPVVITKNGYADLIIMRVSGYERKLARLELYDKLTAAQKQIDSGTPLIDHSELFAELRRKVKADV